MSSHRHRSYVPHAGPIAYAVWGCIGKGSFATFTAAMRKRKLVARHLKAPLTIYRCRACQQWHIGSGSYGGKRHTPLREEDGTHGRGKRQRWRFRREILDDED